ncbi:MAG: CHAT domain-containing protein [bacterium]|nr:CHAT domain-containing protein [bacterium]
MKILKINGTGSSKNKGFQAEVLFPSENKYDVTLQDPFSEPDDIDGNRGERLRWYFEDHLASPYTEREKAKRAAKSIPAYGETLFARLFADPDARAEWRKLVNGLETVRVQVFSQNRDFQALHWEALKDPDETAACCLNGVEFVRTSPAKTPALEVETGTCLNVLMVTARPGGKADIAYRTITRPVVETVEKTRMRVGVHLLRPPTFRELKDHLREKRGFYHIIHFDVHGDVLSLAEYKRAMKGRKGLTRLTKYDGTKAFIFLEAETGGADPAAAEDVAELLRGAHVPMCFLNACRSGMATTAAKTTKIAVTGAGTAGLRLDASLAMKFLERGVRLVLGMGWSLTVTAARIMMTRLYEKLTGGEEPGTALNLARRALADEGLRFEGTDNRVVLEDWLLPVVWGKGDFGLELKKPYREEVSAQTARDKKRKKELEGMKTKGVYGFLGRDVDILEIERRLLDKNILLVKGLGGTGKTTLLCHAAEWWLKTGWLKHVFYFGYDEKPFRAEEILNRVAEGVMTPEEFGGFLVERDVESKALRLSGFLKESKETPQVLLILDNMESITGTKKAVGRRLKKKDREELAAAIEWLMDSTIKILLGSRADEGWLGKRTFTDGVYELEGLDDESRYLLAETILAKTGVTEVGDGGEFDRLMAILAGYPLAMEIILPNLGTRGAKALREALTGGEVDLKGGGVSEEIFKCINISFSLLSRDAGKSMLVFAPFTSFLNAMLLDDYLK